MSSYNLGRASGSVEIVYDSRGIARTTEDMSRLSDRLEALAHQSATIDVNDFEAQRRISELTTQLHELAEERVDPDILLNDEDFRRRFTEIQNQLLELDHDSIDPTVNIHLSPEELAQLRNLRDNLEELDRQTANVDVDINSQLARRELETLQAEVNHLDGQTINIHAKVDSTASKVLGVLTTTATGLFGAFTLAAKGAGILELALAALAAIAPIVDVALGGVLALAGGFIAAASGAALFGGAAITDLHPVLSAYKDLATAQKEYNSATTDQGRANALAKEQQILSGLNTQQRQLLTSVSALKSKWSDLAKSVSPQVYAVANNAITGISNLLPKLKPLLGASADAFVTLSKRVNTALAGPATQKWLGFLTRQAPQAILTFGHAAGTLGSALGSVLEAFEPLIGPAEKALTGFVDRVKAKAQGLATSSGFKQFLDFIRGAAPEVSQAIGSLLRAILDLLKSLEPLAKPILGFITDFGHAISTLVKSPGFAIFVRQIGDAFTTLGKALGDNAGGIGTFLGTFGTLVADLFRNLAPLLPHLILFVTNIARFLDKIVTNPGFPKLVQALGNALDKIGSALASIPPKDISTFLGFITGLVNLAGGLLSFGHGAGIAAIAIGLLGLKALGALGGLGRLLTGLRGLTGAAGGAGGAGLSDLLIPIGITIVGINAAKTAQGVIDDLKQHHFKEAIESGANSYLAKGLTFGLSPAIADALSGNFTKALTDIPGEKTWGQILGGKLSGTLLSPEAGKALQTVMKTYGTNAGDEFGQALINEKGNVQKAWSDVYSDIDPTDAGAKLFGNKGTKGGVSFWTAINGQKTPAQVAAAGLAQNAANATSFWATAGSNNGLAGAVGFWQNIKGQTPGTAAAAGGLAATARNNSIWSGKPNGTNGAVGFWQGINTQQGGAAAAAGGLATAARNNTGWSGFGNGQNGAVGFWQGINAQKPNAAGAGAALAGAAAGGINSQAGNAWSWGSNLGNNFAAGLTGALAAVGAAAGAIASTAAAHMKTGSPAKLGAFSGRNGPDALGLRLVMSYAKGMRQGLAAVRSSAQAISEAAVPGGQGTLTGDFSGMVGTAAMGAVGSPRQGGTNTTTHTKDISYAPVYQYVGPLGSDVTKQAQREFDWSVGS